MKYTQEIIQVDAFTDVVFGGNPACVCIMDEWLPDETMQKIANENNLSETAFIVKENTGLRIRWFTPSIEVDLCGHATLATAHVFYKHKGFNGEKMILNSRSGPLKISKEGLYYVLDFPADPITKVDPPDSLEKALGINAWEIYQGKTDYLCIVGSQKEVLDCNPDFTLLKKLPVRGVIVSSVGDKVDFVSRFFAPGSGVDEDPVTGSAHTSLTPYWADRLSKNKMEAHQLSARGGKLICELDGSRVRLYGRAVTYATGTIYFN